MILRASSLPHDIILSSITTVTPDPAPRSRRRHRTHTHTPRDEVPLVSAGPSTTAVQEPFIHPSIHHTHLKKPLHGKGRYYIASSKGALA